MLICTVALDNYDANPTTNIYNCGGNEETSIQIALKMNEKGQRDG